MNLTTLTDRQLTGMRSNLHHLASTGNPGAVVQLRKVDAEIARRRSAVGHNLPPVGGVPRENPLAFTPLNLKPLQESLRVSSNINDFVRRIASDETFAANVSTAVATVRHQRHGEFVRADYPDGRSVVVRIADSSRYGARIVYVAGTEMDTGNEDNLTTLSLSGLYDKLTANTGLNPGDVAVLDGVSVEVVGDAGTEEGDATQAEVDAFVVRMRTLAQLGFTAGSRPTSWDSMPLAEFRDGAMREYADLDSGSGPSGELVGVRVGAPLSLLATVDHGSLNPPTGATIIYVLKLAFSIPSTVRAMGVR